MSTSCENYGFVNGSSCSCPPGFGGSNCSDPGCGGDIFQGSKRPFAAPIAGSLYSNLTASKCSCEPGWTGVGCNVCQTSSSCQSAFVATGRAPSNESDISSSTLNSTVVCNTTPRVYASSQMSCAVLNPTLQALYPGASTLNILRTLDGSLTPLPDVLGYGSKGSIYAQLWYDGVEQFYCQAGNCTQNSGDGSGGANFNCNNLACQCRQNTTFCGLVPTSDLTGAIDMLNGELDISCNAPANGSSTTSCTFKQSSLVQLFPPNGLQLSGCTFGECVNQNVIDTSSGNFTMETTDHKPLGGGVIAGLAVIGTLILGALLLILLGWLAQRKAKLRGPRGPSQTGGVAVQWTNISYIVPGASSTALFKSRSNKGVSDDKTILDNVSGIVEPGKIMAVLGPSGAGKTTLVEILAGKSKSGLATGQVAFPRSLTGDSRPPRIAFVSQQDVLPATLTVFEALLFAARLRHPESVSEAEKVTRVKKVMEQLGIDHIANTRIGNVERRGVSGGEQRRVSIGLELVGTPDVLVLDEPTSGLDSVSAAKVAAVLRAVAHDNENPTAVIASIHQPSSKLYYSFDRVLVLAHGHSLYSGEGGAKPAEYFVSQGIEGPPEGYNIADYLLEVASDPPLSLLSSKSKEVAQTDAADSAKSSNELEKGVFSSVWSRHVPLIKIDQPGYATTFFTQIQTLSGREWKILRRDKTLVVAHIAVACLLGVFCGGLYFQTGITIAGFQSRVGCLFFLGALIAFSSLSALYNLVEIRPLFLRERSNQYYRPTAWLLSRLIFDVVPLRIIPTIIVSTITYWMAGLSHEADRYFKFLFILVLYAIAMTLFNFLLACVFRNGGVAILISALTGLYQMTFAGFFVHLNDIPPVLRWLQWLCPLKYALEALSVNEVGSGLLIQDTLQGVPVDVSASLIMQLLFGFGLNNYYRDVLVQFAFIVGFGVAVIIAVWFNVRERR